MKRKITISEQQIINAVRKVINEARRNPETNVDESFSEFYNRILNKAPIENIFVSFRDSNHVTDVNAMNGYNTPTGYYTYPLALFDIPENPTEMDFRRKFPFANDRKYINLFILKTYNGILTSKTGRPTLNMYVERIKKLYPNSSKVKELCDSFIDGSYSSDYTDDVIHDTHLFWLLLYDITKGMDDGNKQNRINLICRKIGVNGFIDYGDEFIHSAEPKQSVFFKIKNIGEVFVYEKPKISGYIINNTIKNKKYHVVQNITDNIKIIKLIGLFEKYNLIDKNGEILSKVWFDSINHFFGDFNHVTLNNKTNLINQNGELIFPNQWFDNIERFKNGIAKVEVNSKGVNFINQNGELLSNQWFDGVRRFKDGVTQVKLNGKYNFINQDNELTFPKQWFDSVSYFEDGVAIARLNGKIYRLDLNNRTITRTK